MLLNTITNWILFVILSNSLTIIGRQQVHPNYSDSYLYRGINAIFDSEWRQTIKRIIDTWLIEQNHNRESQYRYPTLDGDKVATYHSGSSPP
jgi:hypothetical protein